MSRDPLLIERVGDTIELTWSGRAAVEVDGVTLAGTRGMPMAAIRRGVVVFFCQSVVLVLHGRAGGREVQDQIGFLGSSEAIREVHV